MIKTILLTGAGGYVGSVLTPKLLKIGYEVRAFDLYIYGDDVFNAVDDKTNLTVIKGDLRDIELLKRSLVNVDAVIHLACISNDPSFELNPDLGKSINYDAFVPLVELSKQAGVERFVYASSSSVYGVRDELAVTEELSLKPLTDYSKYKAMCEDVLLHAREPGFATLILRPATVCGYSPRLRLDLTVNILTNHAITNGEIRVFGGSQLRPNIHIDDMTDLYVQSLQLNSNLIDGEIFNAGYQNHSVMDIAGIVRDTIQENVTITKFPTDDNRSYRVTSQKIAEQLGFIPKRTIEDAIGQLAEAFDKGKVENSMTNPNYFNIKKMQEINLA